MIYNISTIITLHIDILDQQKKRTSLSCTGLGGFLDIMSKDDQQRFYQITLPFIVQCALRLPEV